MFLSTDENPENKYLIAQEYGYSNPDMWNTIGGNGSIASQKRSDTWTNSASGSIVPPYAGGIPLLGGHKYYIESIEHNGTGGDGWGATYETGLSLLQIRHSPLMARHPG